MFLNEVSYTHKGYIYLIKNTVKQIYFQILVQFKIMFFFFDIL